MEKGKSEPPVSYRRASEVDKIKVGIADVIGAFHKNSVRESPSKGAEYVLVQHPDSETGIAHTELGTVQDVALESIDERDFIVAVHPESFIDVWGVPEMPTTYKARQRVDGDDSKPNIGESGFERAWQDEYYKWLHEEWSREIREECLLDEVEIFEMEYEGEEYVVEADVEYVEDG